MSDKPFKDDRIFIEPPNHVSLISREHLESLQSELSDLRSKLAQSEKSLAIIKEDTKWMYEDHRECSNASVEASHHNHLMDRIYGLEKKLAKSEAELVAARAVVEAVRVIGPNNRIGFNYNELIIALEAYDAATKPKEEV